MALSSLRERSLFLAIAAAELAHTAVAILWHRAPAGHDGFQYTTLQYFFLNNAIQSHEIAQWIPFMTHGTVAARWFGIQGGFLQNSLLYVAPLLRHADLLAIHYLAVFFDELILLTGTWLLARRFFNAPATFFVSVSVLGTCVWLDQPYWNFRLYYAVPLVLEAAHRFLDSGRWRWFFLAANLLAIQTIGNLPYFIPFTSFVVFAYFVCYTATNLPQVVGRLRALEWRWPAVCAIGLAVASFYLVYKCVTVGMDQVVDYNVGRHPDGTTDLQVFLGYGGLTDLRKWSELVLRASPVFDNTLYAGMLVPPLLLAGAAFADRKRLHLVLLAATILLFTLGSVVATVAFYGWPGMKYFRHIGLASALVKVLFCFVAGIGFEALYGRTLIRNRWAVRTLALAGAVLLTAGAWRAISIARSPAAVSNYVETLTVETTVRSFYTFDAAAVAAQLRWAAIWALCGALLVALAPLVLSVSRVATPRVRAAVLCVVLLFATVDAYAFKFEYLFDRSDGVGAAERFVWRPAAMPFTPQRDRDLHQTRATSARLAATLRFNRLLDLRFNHAGWFGAQYWTNNAFWFVDEINHTLQADSWLAPVDQLARAFNAEPGINFPLDRPAAARVGGMAAGKIRFFTHAYRVDAPSDLMALLTSPSYAGDRLFLLPIDAADARGLAASATAWAPDDQLSGNDSVDLEYNVERFDANNLTLRVSNVDGRARWLFYSDAWHPFWRATVNSRPAPVYRADLAYKAVSLQPGENVVRFHFGSRVFSWLAALTAANGALWLGAVAWAIRDVVRADRVYSIYE